MENPCIAIGLLSQREIRIFPYEVHMIRHSGIALPCSYGIGVAALFELYMPTCRFYRIRPQGQNPYGSVQDLWDYFIDKAPKEIVEDCQNKLKEANLHSESIQKKLEMLY